MKFLSLGLKALYKDYLLTISTFLPALPGKSPGRTDLTPAKSPAKSLHSFSSNTPCSLPPGLNLVLSVFYLPKESEFLEKRNFVLFKELKLTIICKKILNKYWLD